MSQQEIIYVFSFNNHLPRIFVVVNTIITVEPTVLLYKKGRPELVMIPETVIWDQFHKK